MRYPVCTLALALLAAGCASNPTPPKSSRGDPLAGIVPNDKLEADLIAHPQDARSLADHARWLFNLAGTKEESEAKPVLRKARSFAAAALAAGSTDLFMNVMLESLGADGTQLGQVYSKNPAANALILSGEKHFTAGDMDGALAQYAAAWAIDPKAAHTALFMGDVHFRNKEFTEAISWFDRAIALDPAFETPYRYRGDALLKLHRTNDANESYASAVIASPYSRLTRSHFHAPRSDPLIQPHFPPGKMTVEKDKFSLLVDENAGLLSMSYLIFRAGYCEQHKTSPQNYRHSLDEEAFALRETLKSATEMLENPDSKKDVERYAPQLAVLRDLDEKGLLEAHILLDRADDGIARDFAEYREKHAAELRRYIRVVWLKQSS